MSSSNSGCGTTAVFVLLFIISAALNAALLSGCITSGKCLLCGREKDTPATSSSKNVYDAADDLREIANKLGIETEKKGASELASAIKTQLYVGPTARGFPRELLTDQQMKGVKMVISPDTSTIIAEYQYFIKSLEGKRFLVIP